MADQSKNRVLGHQIGDPLGWTIGWVVFLLLGIFCSMAGAGGSPSAFAFGGFFLSAAAVCGFQAMVRKLARKLEARMIEIETVVKRQANPSLNAPIDPKSAAESSQASQ